MLVLVTRTAVTLDVLVGLGPKRCDQYAPRFLPCDLVQQQTLSASLVPGFSTTFSIGGASSFPRGFLRGLRCSREKYAALFHPVTIHNVR